MLNTVSVNVALAIVCGFALLWVGRGEQLAAFGRNLGLAQLTHAAALMGLAAWQSDIPMLFGLGFWAFCVFSAATLIFSGSAMAELSDCRLQQAWLWSFFVFISAVYALLLESDLKWLFEALNTLLYVGIGLCGQHRLRAKPRVERMVAVLATLFGGSALYTSLQPLAGMQTQLQLGAVLGVVLTLTSLYASLTRSRIRSERALKRFETLSDRSFQGVLVSDGSLLLYANQAARQVLRPISAAADLAYLAQALWQLVSAEELQSLITGQRQWTDLLRETKLPDGTLMYVRMSSWPTEWDDKPAVHILIRDDTENQCTQQRLAALQGQAEQQRAEYAQRVKIDLLQANAELESKVKERTLAMEQASKAKSQFLANMSHEIRTPMNVVLGLLQLLHASPLNAQQQDFAEKATSAARSLLGLLNNILDFSRIDAGKLELEIAPFEPERLMRDLSVILAGNHTMHQRVEVLFDLDPTMPGALMGDASRLLQILINLSSNALKFTPVGEVVVQCVVTQSSSASATLRFGVHDTGIGIARHNQDHIFEVFSQAEASSTRRFGGSGLGLSVCQRLLGLMNSALCLESSEGEGSYFYFDITLPLCAVVTAPNNTEPMPSGTELSVLVIDDNPSALRLLSAMASGLGWHVDSASSSAQAIALAQQRVHGGQSPYQVVLVDWEMPDRNGWQTLEDLDSVFPAAQAPIAVMVSSHGRECLELRSARELSRLSAFLTKPVTPGMLAEAIVNACRGRGNLRTAARPVAQRQARLDGMRLLLAEDNPLNQLVALELLRAEGAVVLAVDDGRACVKAVANSTLPFDAILMDMQMPVMDGCSATRTIRQTLGNTEIPVIAMTANTMPSDREACLDAGMNDHVGKPFDINYLVQVLRLHTGRAGSEVQQKTYAVPAIGADTEETLRVDKAIKDMGGDQQLYTEVVQIWLQDLKAFPALLTQYLQANERAAAERLVHTLKGTAATVGAVGLSAKAQLLEQDIREAEQSLTELECLPAFLEAVSAVHEHMLATYHQLTHTH